MKTLLQGARVIDALNGIDDSLDIVIEGGTISELGKNLPPEKNTVNYAGKTIIPGVIDMHVHLTEELGGRAGYRMAAKTGVTTLIDYAGPIDDIMENAARLGCGLNIGCLHAINPGEYGNNPSASQVQSVLERSLQAGAVGLKVLGGHFPLSPEASALAIKACNERKVFVAAHCGTTRERSDIRGMKESVELADGNRLLLAHINAYCRGKYFPATEELRQAFEILRENTNLIADSHMAIINGTQGVCHDGVPHDAITVNCLKLFAREPTEAGLSAAILDGLVKVIYPGEEENILLEGKAAHDYWRAQGTNADVSFPANNPVVAVSCVLERRKPGGDFLIPLTATDGGGFPRNNLIGKLLSLYHVGYISLHDIVWKVSLNPARVFGLSGKGKIAVGADADLTVLDESLLKAVASYVNGSQVMKDGAITGSGATLVATEAARESAKAHGLNFTAVDSASSAFYAGL